MRRLITLAMLVTLLASCGGTTAAGPDRPVRILSGEPTTLDPAGQGDAGSAAITAQLFESLTAFDADLQVRPALAESWTFADGGRQVTFKLRPNLTFSDGSPLRPSDVSRSWLRLIDPKRPSPLASLAFDIEGAEAYVRGQSTDPASVGLHADDAAGTLTVDLARPATDFVNIVAGPSFGVVPPGVDADPGPALRPGKDFVSSGGYVLSGTTDDGLELTANDRYWAGKPAITTIDLVADLGGKGSVDAFSAGDLDYAPVRRHRRQLAGLRREARTAAPAGRFAGGRLLRLRRVEAAVRRSARPPGVRRGGRLAPDGRAVAAPTAPSRSRTPWSRPASPAGATRTSCRRTIRTTRASSSPRRATRAGRASRRRPC